MENALREYEVTCEAACQVRWMSFSPRRSRCGATPGELYSGGEVNVVSYLNAQREYNDTVKQYLDTAVRHHAACSRHEHGKRLHALLLTKEMQDETPPPA